MKRIEMLAWSAVAGLLGIGAILLCGGLMYQFTAFWAGMMLALGQALVVGLAAWGLMLSRQAAELGEGGPILGGSKVSAGESGGGAAGFRMSMGGDENAADLDKNVPEAKTLETGFQRVVVGISAVILIALAIVTSYLIYRTVTWARMNPDQPVPIAGVLPAVDKPLVQVPMDELALVIGLGAAGLYGVLYWITRNGGAAKAKREAGLETEVLHGIFVLGVGGMAALGVASVLGYLKFGYASEVASGIIAGLMVLQGLELLVNCLRSYSGIEELDQEAVDLQSLPLVPMLGSAWLSGLKMLAAQSVGLSGERAGEKGVIARMMPRTLTAIALIAVGMSCLRVVKPGEVAVLERLGSAAMDAKGELSEKAILQPGLHVEFPWPIDDLVRIPTETLQYTDVGAELHGSKGTDNVEYQFWTVGLGNIDPDVEAEARFVTGDSGGQILETYVGVWWRVRDAKQFYKTLSHSDFFERGNTATKALPIYEAMVQECASYAVTRTFAIHTLDQVMIQDRTEVETHCKDILQKKLDSLNSEGDCGIEVVALTIQDLHPPFWKEDQPDPAEWDGVKRGPASAFENVVSNLEIKQLLINQALRGKVRDTKQAEGQAALDLSAAKAYAYDRVATAEGESARVVSMMAGGVASDAFLQNLAERQAFYRGMQQILDPVNKVVVDPSVHVEMMQTTDKGVLPSRPPGQ